MGRPWGFNGPVRTANRRFASRHETGGLTVGEAVDEPARRKVTLVWDRDDVADAFGTLFDDGTPAKYLDLPHTRYAVFQYDEVRRGDETVGVSKDCAYSANERAMLSLAVVDTAVSDPGTELTLVWGEPSGDSPNPAVERHTQTEIGATVAPVPIVEDRLKPAA